MRKFTLSVAALMLAASAFAADVVVKQKPEEKAVYFTFTDYSSVVPGLYMGNSSCTATLNGDDVTYSIMPTLSENGEDYGNSVYFWYMMYGPALSNGGELPDGEYTITFSEGFLTFDYVESNTEPIEVSFTIGNTTGISTINTTTATQRYNLQGQKINGAQGISVVNGQKILVK